MPMPHYDALYLLFHGPRETFDRAKPQRFLPYTRFIKLLHLAYLSSALRRDLDLDKTVGSRVWRHTQGSSARPASDLGWGSSSKTTPGSLSTGSPASRTPPHGDGSMYSQANVLAGKVLRSPTRALPSVTVVTEKVMREADGHVGSASLTAHFGWKGVRPGVRLESRSAERSPKNISAHV